MPEPSDRRGSLAVVGGSIRTVGQLTMESIAQIRAADHVLTILCDSFATAVVERLNPGRCECISYFYSPTKRREITYREMAERTMECVRSGLRTCLVVYGHPGVYATPTHEAVRLARAEGFTARMFPAISAEDCLIADLGVDPATSGCVSLEATDYLYCRYKIDPAFLLLLWQIGSIGVDTQPTGERERFGIPLLAERLAETYPSDHLVTIYQASILPNLNHFALTIPIRDLPEAEFPGMATLCVPPQGSRNYDYPMIDRLTAARDAAQVRPTPPLAG